MERSQDESSDQSKSEVHLHLEFQAASFPLMTGVYNVKELSNVRFLYVGCPKEIPPAETNLWRKFSLHNL